MGSETVKADAQPQLLTQLIQLTARVPFDDRRALTAMGLFRARCGGHGAVRIEYGGGSMVDSLGQADIVDGPALNERSAAPDPARASTS